MLKCLLIRSTHMQQPFQITHSAQRHTWKSAQILTRRNEVLFNEIYRNTLDQIPTEYNAQFECDPNCT